MKILVDGKEIAFKKDVEIIYEGMANNHTNDSLHIKCNTEEIKAEIVSEGVNIGQSSVDASEIYETLMGGNSPFVSNNNDTPFEDDGFYIDTDNEYEF